MYIVYFEYRQGNITKEHVTNYIFQRKGYTIHIENIYIHIYKLERQHILNSTPCASSVILGMFY